jgi:hypothetical protein
MSFFDDKEEILNIELTPYGKFLLSKGKFKPYFYSFFDDEIIYDAKHCNLTESQNDIQERIINETPIFKPQIRYSSANESALLNTYVISDETTKLRSIENQISADKNYALALPLGKSSNNNIYYPAWQISMLNGYIAQTIPYIDNSLNVYDSLQPFLKYPQLNLTDSKYKVLINKNKKIEEKDFNTLSDSITDNATNTEYFFYIKDDNYTIEISELNVNDEKENFEIEVFIEEQKNLLGTNNTVTYWKQLYFPKNLVYVKNNILLDEPENIAAQEAKIDGSYVDNYLEILVDEELELTPKQLIKLNIYESNVTDPPFGDNC